VVEEIVVAPEELEVVAELEVEILPQERDQPA
jgi:hypothetical protein